MLKKVIIGIICFILLVIAGAGVYIYTLNWNKHKVIVAERLTQITGLRSLIDGNLKVSFFPQPKIIATRVKFFSDTDQRIPLVVINEITANLELSPLFDNKFVVRSMLLTQPSVNLIISEEGNFNWKNVGRNGHNKSGNVEVSFDRVQINNATVILTNEQKGTEYTLSNISAAVSAPTLRGPYKTNGKFIHNNSEITFNGTISQNDSLALNMTVDNAITGSKFMIDGTLGAQAKGTVSFDTQSLARIVNNLFGEDSLSDHYLDPLFVSFKYDYNADIAKLDNFTTKYGQNTAGSGNILVDIKDTKNIAAEFNMTQFNLDVAETIVRDYINFVKQGGNYTDTLIAPFNIAFKLRSPTAFYKNTEAQKLNIGFNLVDGMLDITNFGIVMSGETAYKAMGKVNLNDKLQYSFNQTLRSEDFRTFASIFGIDLTKLTAPEYKKSVFKRIAADKVLLKGDLDSFMLYAPQVSMDSTKLGFNIHFSENDEKPSLNVEVAASKILFDKYLQILPQDMKNASIKDKFLHQLKIIPWDDNVITTAKIAIENAVYNQIPMEDVALQFTKENDDLTINSLIIKNFAGAAVEVNLDAEKVFTDPQFKELSYNIKTSNFPAFASAVGVTVGDLELFKRKLFAAQGAFAGNFHDFSLSSIQKFGDAEFSYTGLVSNSAEGLAVVNGDLEIKANNFTNFIKALNIDYTPSIPVTVFTASGKVKGNIDLFELSNVDAHLGANKISGLIQLDKTTDKPKLKTVLNFDKFDADHWLGLASNNKAKTNRHVLSDFISKPDLDSEKIDYSRLQEIDFDIEANSRSFVFDNTTYQTTKLKALLKNGKLNVSSFETQDDDHSVKLSFVLDTNKQPFIEGQYDVYGIKLPNLGGAVYQISNGTLVANGTFSSRADTQKDFFESLNSQGDFQLLNPIVKGWDLDIIKFDIEQRKQTDGLEEFVMNSLKNGKSAFSKVSGAYNVTEGNLVADNVLWQSPVVDMSMQFNLNLSDYLFKALFEAVYHNASFSDVLKFTMDGNLSSPKLRPDLQETLARIRNTERSFDVAKRQKEIERNEKIKDKQQSIRQNIGDVLSEIKRISGEVGKYEPHSKDQNVIATYMDTLDQLKAAEQKMTALQDTLTEINTEKALMDLDADLKIETAKLQVLSKSLEDNYMVDRKYIYDEFFNKISWVYNVASNNVAYFNGLSDAYVKQLNLIKKGTNPLDPETEKKLLKSIKKVSQDMDKISQLHTKMRDDYLFIVDATEPEVMKDNIEIVEQALKTILSYTQLLYKDIISSVEDFIVALELTSRDYDDYMITPPENIADIDVSAPTIKPQKKEVKSQTKKEALQSNVSEDVLPDSTAPVQTEEPLLPKEDKKKANDELSKLQTIQNNLFMLINSFKDQQKAKKQLEFAANISSIGLSSLLSTTDDVSESPSTTAEEIPTQPKPSEIATIENMNEEVGTFAKDNSETPSEAISSEQTLIASAESFVAETDETSEYGIEKNQTAHNGNVLAQQLSQTNAINISDYIIAEENTKTVLKRNPVIALEIGKELSKASESMDTFKKRTAFKFKKARYNDVIQSFADKPGAKLPLTAEQPVSKKREIFADITLPKVIAFNNEENPFDIRFIEANMITKEQTPAVDNRKFVFAANSSFSALTGNIGKSMHPKEKSATIDIPHKYIFAANSVSSSSDKGSLRKNKSLYAK